MRTSGAGAPPEALVPQARTSFRPIPGEETQPGRGIFPARARGQGGLLPQTGAVSQGGQTEAVGIWDQPWRAREALTPADPAASLRELSSERHQSIFGPQGRPLGLGGQIPKVRACLSCGQHFTRGTLGGFVILTSSTVWPPAPQLKGGKAA